MSSRSIFRSILLLAIASVLPILALSQGTSSTTDVVPPIRPASVRVGFKTVVSGIASPVYATSTSGLQGKLFVVDQPGKLWLVDLKSGKRSVYLNLSSLLIHLGIPSLGNYDERGFLGVAFHPDFATNGLFYTFTSEPARAPADFTYPQLGLDCPQRPRSLAPDHQNVIREWHVSNATNANSRPDSRSRVVMRVDWPNFNHNGGTVAFGPDRKLYISFGDGGGEDDQLCQIGLDHATTIGHPTIGLGQDRYRAYSKVLRIDVDARNSANGQYGVPKDNPYHDGVRETFAWGLRNPYRISFDAQNGQLWTSDAGQNDIEEVDMLRSGANYGWRIKEGTFDFEQKTFALVNGDSDGAAGANSPGHPARLTDPVGEYAHEHNGVHQATVSIGGFVYRGSSIPYLRGRYVFGDYSKDDTKMLGGWVLTLSYGTWGAGLHPVVSLTKNPIDIFVLGFGQDNDHEIYVMGNKTGTPFGNTGEVRRLVASH